MKLLITAGKGAADMVAKCKKVGVKVMEVSG